MRPQFMFPAALLAVALVPHSALTAATLDGLNIPSEGITLRATQNSPTSFGNATGGGQDSAGGSELNQLFADIDGDTLTLGITGNLEGNYNKMFIFFDAVDGGEAVLANDNADGGFGEINNLAGLSFGGVTMDHGLRIEVGGGYWGVNGFDLIDNTAFNSWSGGGPGNLPVANVGSGGIAFGWDNSNILGVTGSDASTASTATKGWEFEIDMPTFFGASPNAVRVTAFVTNGSADFISNQVLPGVNGGNVGSPSNATIGSAIVPEPSAIALCVLGLSALAYARTRRS